MRIIDYVKISFQNLFRQKVRTLLTIFSIVIGATLITLVYAVIPGFERFFNIQFNMLSVPELVEVTPSQERPGRDILGGLGKNPQEYDESDVSGSFDWELGSFKDADIEKIRSLNGVKAVYESVFPGVDYVRLEGEEKKFETGFVFFYPKFVLQNIDLVAGRYIENGETGKAVIANQYLNSFGIENPNDIIGKKINLHIAQIPGTDTYDTSSIDEVELSSDMLQSSEEVEPSEKEVEFEIVGVTEKTIISSVVFIPYEDGVEMVRYIKNDEGAFTDKDNLRQYLAVELTDASYAEEVDRKIEELGFSASTFEENKGLLNDIFNVITIIFSSFGVLAMAVSSLGILNTLIMAVMERTREIGVMKAVGATKKNIAIMFTLEAAFIGFWGGMIGLGLGYGLAEIVNIVSHNTFLEAFETLDLSNVTPLLVLGPAISTIVSTLAGIYPSVRASKLDPVEALRYE
jgi:putative ABC transport system permease protein